MTRSETMCIGIWVRIWVYVWVYGSYNIPGEKILGLARHLAEKREQDLPRAWPEPRIHLSRGRNENKTVSGLHQSVSTTSPPQHIFQSKF